MLPFHHILYEGTFGKDAPVGGPGRIFYWSYIQYPWPRGGVRVLHPPMDASGYLDPDDVLPKIAFI